MQTLIYKFFSVLILITYLFSAGSCGSNENKNEQRDSILKVQKKPFSVNDYNFAILEDNKFIQYNKAIYQRGDEVYMVLADVGPFAVGSDGLNFAEMRLEVTDAIGQEVIVRENLFGERGHDKFINNVLSSPYASYSSEMKDKPGKYSMSVTVYDLVSKDSIVVSDDFFLE